MSKKNKRLEDCRTWDDLANYAQNHGIPYDHTNGGHRVHKPNDGGRPIPFSAHQKEPDKDTRCRVMKEIRHAVERMGIIATCIFIGLWIFSHLA